MPTYDYRCEACGHEFEEFQMMSAKPLRKCPECGKSKLKRLIGTGAGVIFKGSGFWQTDYRSDGYQKDAKADKDAAKKGSETKTSDAGTKNTDGQTKTDSAAKKTDAAPAKPAPKKKSD